jgi:hypothetical protein
VAAHNGRLQHAYQSAQNFTQYESQIQQQMPAFHASQVYHHQGVPQGFFYVQNPEF